MVETLDSGKGEDIDEEEVYKMAGVLGKANRLDAILQRQERKREREGGKRFYFSNF